MEKGFFPPSSRKELLAKVVCAIIIFVAGVVVSWWIREDYYPRSFTLHSEVFLPAATPHTTSCNDGSISSLKHFIHPSILMHDMSDEELFWRASMVPMARKHPFKMVPKVAFMFMTRGPLPLSPLWDRFFEGHQEFYSVYVHADPGYNISVPEKSAFYGRQIPSEEVQWGSISLLDAEKRLLANALLDFSNERFVLLSESCIPIFDFATVYNYLLNSSSSFVQSYDEKSSRGRGRYNRHMAPKIRRWQWRKGSEWFELQRELAVSIVAEMEYYSIFREHCKPSCYPDEHYLPTYLSMFYQPMIANRSITWVDWSIKGPHPVTYGHGNITKEFIQSIRGNGSSCVYNSRLTSICFLFARKFTPNALEPLLKLSSEVMNF